jgi:hypothetical protein
MLKLQCKTTFNSVFVSKKNHQNRTRVDFGIMFLENVVLHEIYSKKSQWPNTFGTSLYNRLWHWLLFILFTHSWLITGFVTRVTWQVPLVEQELFTLPGHLSSPLVFSGVGVTRSLIFCVAFCRSLFVLLSFFFWPLCCLSFFDLWTNSAYPFGIFKLFFDRNTLYLQYTMAVGCGAWETHDPSGVCVSLLVSTGVWIVEDSVLLCYLYVCIGVFVSLYLNSSLHRGKGPTI